MYENGRIEIPLRSLPLLKPYSLSGEEYFITSIVVDLFLSTKREKTGFSKTLEKLIEVSQKIPIPASPYVEYASIFGTEFSSVIDEAIKEGAKTVPFSTFGLRFLVENTVQTEKFTERPGVYAIIMGSLQNIPGYVDLETMKRDELTFDDVHGLKYRGNSVKNNHLVVRIVKSTDPFKAVKTAEIENTLKSLSEERPAAIALSKKYNKDADNLNKVYTALEAGPGNKVHAVHPEMPNLGKAIEELNIIRAINPLQSP
jgi:hypothetical protein